MKKQILTKQIIQQALLAKMSKKKTAALFLTFVLLAEIIVGVMYVIAYANGAELKNDRLSFAVPHVSIPVMFVVILILTFFLLDYYYVDLYKIKRCKFYIVEEKLCEKKKETVKYYRHTEKEKFLCFRCGKVSVEDDVYYCSDIGERFYIIELRANKAPMLAYSTKYYEIN